MLSDVVMRKSSILKGSRSDSKLQTGVFTKTAENGANYIHDQTIKFLIGIQNQKEWHTDQFLVPWNWSICHPPQGTLRLESDSKNDIRRDALT